MKYRALGVFALIVLIVTIGYARVGMNKTQVVPTPPHPQTAQRVEPEAPEPVVFPVVITDAAGRQVRLTAPPRRIVSLAPSATELLFDLGAGDRIVGDTTACDWPPRAALLPHIGGAFDMSLESIAAKNPDLIIADKTINQKIIYTLQAAGLPVLVIEPKDLESSFISIRMLGRSTGETGAAADLINNSRKRFEAIEKIVAIATSRRRVLVMYDVSPTIYTSGPGTLVDDMIRIAGGQNLAKSNDPLDSESVIQSQPDVIICSPSLDERIKNMPGWAASIPAVTNTAFFHTGNSATLIRPGIRLAAGAEELARFLHPELFTSDGKAAPAISHAHPAPDPG